MPRIALCIWLFGVALVAGCGPTAQENSQSPSPLTPLPYVPWNEIPMSVKNAARAQRPDVKFHNSGFRTPAGGYQIRGRDRKGNGVAIDITRDGVVLLVHTY
jgi:hypothetical protein